MNRSFLLLLRIFPSYSLFHLSDCVSLRHLLIRADVNDRLSRGAHVPPTSTLFLQVSPRLDFFSHSPGKTARGSVEKGPWMITLDFHIVGPFLESCSIRSLYFSFAAVSLFVVLL